MIIGITGKKGSGKTAVADYLVDKYSAVKINFKDALIAEIAKNFPNLIDAMIDSLNKTDYNGMSEWNYARLVKDKPPLFRTLMQNYGTEVRRGDSPDYWVAKWLKVVSRTSGLIVTDDVRFINEYDAVRGMGGSVIRVFMESQHIGMDYHASEMEMDLLIPDHTVISVMGDKDGLYRQVDDLLTTIQHKA